MLHIETTSPNRCFRPAFNAGFSESERTTTPHCGGLTDWEGFDYTPDHFADTEPEQTETLSETRVRDFKTSSQENDQGHDDLSTEKPLRKTDIYAETSGRGTRFGARWYAPAIGRWISADLMYLEGPGENVGSPLEAGLFSYVTNNPINGVDPTGMGEEVPDTSQQYDKETEDIMRGQTVDEGAEEDVAAKESGSMDVGPIHKKAAVADRTLGLSTDESNYNPQFDNYYMGDSPQYQAVEENEYAKQEGLNKLKHGKGIEQKIEGAVQYADAVLNSPQANQIPMVGGLKTVKKGVKTVEKAAKATKGTTKSGIGVTKHSVEQKINRGVRSADELDAIKNPLKKGSVKTDQLGRPSQRHVGKKAEVAINPETGKIVSVNPTSTKKAQRLMRQLEETK